MDQVIALALLIGGVIGFVLAVRRSRKQRAERESKPWQGDRPSLLSSEQRKGLGLKASRPGAAPVRPSLKPSRSTRAIRTGWSIGDVEFTYEDSAGDITRRRVTVHSVTSTYMKGECHYRQAERTFRIDRIIGDVVDCDTGEILPPRKWAAKAKS